MRIILNIEKRYVYSILATLIILTGIVAVYALNSGNGNIMGHTPDELLPGTFGNGGNLDLWYTFQNPVHMDKNLLVGLAGPGTVQGIITLKGGQYSRGDPDDVIIDNSGGGLRVSNATWSQLFLLSNNGNIITKPGAWIQTTNIALNGNLCIGPDPGDHSNCKTTWPTTPAPPTQTLGGACVGSQASTDPWNRGRIIPWTVSGNTPAGSYNPISDGKNSQCAYTVYDQPGGRYTYMGSHSFCFLTSGSVSIGGWGNVGCSVAIGPDGNWNLRAGYETESGAKAFNCGAYCIN